MFPEAKITWISPKIQKPDTDRKILVVFRDVVEDFSWVDESYYDTERKGFAMKPVDFPQDIKVIAWAEWPEAPVTNA